MSQQGPKKDSRSPVRKVYDAAERAVASRAEPVAQSGGFATALSIYVAANRRVGRVLRKATGGILHVVSIPTSSDVSRIHQHLSSVDRHIADLIRELEGQPSESAGEDVAQNPPGGRSTATTKPTQPRKRPAARGVAPKPGKGTTPGGP
jgi:hypothetical protein